MRKIGPVDPEIWAKMWSKSGQIGVPERFFENISRNMIVPEKIIMSNIIGNIVARQYCLWGGSASSSS